MAAIEILDLEKSYLVGFWRKRPKPALRPLRLTIEEGEVFGFLGPNGAGKTTTLKLLMGLVFPTAGTNYYAQLSGVPAKERSARVEQMLARVGLSDSAGVQVRKFSKGMLQRLGLAQAIVHDPKLVVLDEPMSGLDPIGRREVRDLIQQMRHEGKTVFFSTHILSDAEALCDRVGVIHQGELRGVGAVAELTSQTQGKVEIIFYSPTVPAGLSSLWAEARLSGDMVNAVLPEEQQDAALEVLRQQRLKLISLTPVRSSLEEYYIQKLQPPEDRTKEGRNEDGRKEESRKGVGV